MNGYDAQIYEKTKRYAEDLGLKLTINGDKFVLERCGTFDDVYDLFNYLCGYEAGRSKNAF